MINWNIIFGFIWFLLIINIPFFICCLVNLTKFIFYKISVKNGEYIEKYVCIYKWMNKVFNSDYYLETIKQKNCRIIYKLFYCISIFTVTISAMLIFVVSFKIAEETLTINNLDYEKYNKSIEYIQKVDCEEVTKKLSDLRQYAFIKENIVNEKIEKLEKIEDGVWRKWFQKMNVIEPLTEE